MPRSVRPIRIEGNIAFVPLTQGYEAIIDAADADLVGQWNWFAHVTGRTVYATRKHRTVYLHSFLARTPKGFETDHIDGDGLNNRRANLRVVTRSQNQQNSRKPVTNTSGFKGVYWSRKSQKWCAAIRKNGRSKYLGLFDTAEQAFWVYCEASADFHGDYGRVA